MAYIKQIITSGTITDIAEVNHFSDTLLLTNFSSLDEFHEYITDLLYENVVPQMKKLLNRYKVVERECQALYKMDNMDFVLLPTFLIYYVKTKVSNSFSHRNLDMFCISQSALRDTKHIKVSMETSSRSL
jgi:hypothetical protein